MVFLCNALNDPSDPWYYVLGIFFLLLVFGALALYIFLSKRKKSGTDAEEKSEPPVTDAKSNDQSATETTEPERSDEASVEEK